ncbi:radical SAM protein [Candidatus Dependentiae bacterium]|nr:radical SAM protein [Candidatus Dependentiae bacterium]
MIAHNLAICIPNKGCNKNCPYCVSRMTGYIDSDFELMKKQMKKVIKISEMSGVTSILMTGKGEPFLGIPELEFILKGFNEFVIEIQTNGIWLNNNLDYIKELSKQGLNLAAFSLDRIEQFEEYSDMFSQVKANGMIVRVTLNITDMLPENLTFKECIELCKKNNVDQFSIRNIVIPNNISNDTKGSRETVDWIKTHVPENFYNRLVQELETEVKASGFLLRSLPYGAKVYDYQGVSVTYFDYCVQDSNTGDDIRSLIFQENGHLYTNWNSKASILF